MTENGLSFILLRPSSNISVNIFLFFPNAVSVTVSHGTPMCKSKVCCSLVLSTLIQLFLYLRQTLHINTLLCDNLKKFKLLEEVYTNTRNKVIGC